MYYFIVNPKSKTGKGKKLWTELESVLKEREIEYKVFFTERIGHAKELASEICGLEGLKRIVVVGGDGTANEAINGLSGLENLTLGYIATGSGNDLAKGLGIPKDPVRALQNILEPKYFSYCDIGKLEYPDTKMPAKRFAVSSGIGYDAEVCENVSASKVKKVLNKIKLGKLVYFVLGTKTALTNQPTDAVFSFDGGVTERKITGLNFCASMIHRCEGGNLPMGPHANPSDGKLTCCVVHGVGHLRFLSLMPTIFFGKHIGKKGIEEIHCETVDIRTVRPLVLHTDGEYAGKVNHVRLSCKEKLRFISGREA